MIEFLFRGKRLDNGEWIESNSSISFMDTENTVYLTKYETPVHTDVSGYGNLRSISSGGYEEIFYRVDPSTVGIWTGLYDDAGEKVFVCGGVD